MPPKAKRFPTTQLAPKYRSGRTRAGSSKLGSTGSEGKDGGQKGFEKGATGKRNVTERNERRGEIVLDRGDADVENEDGLEDNVCCTTRRRAKDGSAAPISKKGTFTRLTRSIRRMAQSDHDVVTEKGNEHSSKNFGGHGRRNAIQEIRNVSRNNGCGKTQDMPGGTTKSLSAIRRTVNQENGIKRRSLRRRGRSGGDTVVEAPKEGQNINCTEDTLPPSPMIPMNGEKEGEDAVNAEDSFARRNKRSFANVSSESLALSSDEIVPQPAPSPKRRKPVGNSSLTRAGDGGNAEDTHGLEMTKAASDTQDGSLELSSANEFVYDVRDEPLYDVPETAGRESRGMNNPGIYNYINRVRATPRPTSDLLKRRSATADKDDEIDFKKWTCCKRLKCFLNVNAVYFRAQRCNLLKASQAERKKALQNMLGDDNKFHFNHRVVCTFFLYHGFGFSKDLQRSVKGTPGAPATPLLGRIPKTRHSSDQREFIMSFLKSIAASTAEQMPDTSEQHLPFHQKRHVYDMFCESMMKFPVFGVTREPASFSYFVKTWNDEMKHLKVRAVKRFTKCGECESTRMALVRAAKDHSETAGILELRKRHLKFIQRERADYVTRAQMAVTNPMKVCSIVVDGADQSNFGLPHFTSITKETRGEALKVKLVGLLEHGSAKALYLFTMTGQFETGANHVVECIHRWLNKKASVQGLPPTLLVQLDNCSRENKNRFLFAYLECLVAWGVFEEIQASFLPVGHTHSDIDQTFSCTSRRLKVNDAVTMSDLHEQLRKSYTPNPSVSSLLHVANFSGLVQSSACLQSLPPFSQYRFFKFSRRAGKPRSGSAGYNTMCTVKGSCDDEWESLSKQHEYGFLKFAPELCKTPKTVLSSPDNGLKVTERIDSEEGRINDDEKVQDLRNLRDDVYRCREDPFHWNLESSVEIIAAKGEAMKRPGTEDTMSPSYVPHTRVSYDHNSFVIVRPKPRTRECPFWLAQVLDQHRNSRGDVYKITIRWYEVNENQNVFDGSYTPSFRDDENGGSVPWIVDISTDTVMFNFPLLTYHERIGRTVVRRIQSALHSQP